MEQTFTMMTEEETPEVGPNDIVIHLVNPYKCGMCELEFLEKAVFKDHIFTHLEQIKQERPSSQIVMNIVLPPETPGGVTVTRDILQLGEDGSIKQVSQPANISSLNQVYPLKELEAAGVIKLEPPNPVKPAPVAPTVSTLATQGITGTPQAVNLPNALVGKETQTITPSEGPLENINPLDHSQNPVAAAAGTFIKEEGGENDVSEIIENTDGTFSVAFKGPNNEMQHIQIIRPEGMKGEMMLELTNVHNRRRSSKGVFKSNECDICGKVLSSSTNLLRHKMYHSSERPFVCNTCGKGFKDVSNLKKHTMIHNRIFPCHLCKKSFLRKSLLALHLKRHQARTVFVKCGNGAKEVTLKTFVDDDGTRVEEMSMVALSGQTFEYKKRIVKGEPMETKPVVSNGEEPVESANEIANDDAPAVEDLSNTENGEQKGSDESLIDQMLVPKETQSTGSGEAVDDLPDFKVQDPPKEFVKMYQCGHCGKRTVQRGNMMRHLIHHLNDKPFSCDECPKQFVDKGELVKHKKTHSKPYRCNQCNGAFAHNVQLMKHQESECLGRTGDLKYTALEDGQTYRCDICQIEMKRLGNMIKHVGTHSSGKHRLALRHSAKKMTTPSGEVKPVLTGPYTFNEANKSYVCNYCQKVFKFKSNLLDHMPSHSNEWTHECSNCERRFPSKVALDKHQAVHLKPFKCDRCPAVFSRKLFLETHMRRHKEKERGEETDDYGVSEDKSQYYCKHCDKKLSQKFRMMNHIRSHLDNRPFECSECNKCFSGQFMLSNHKKMHAKLFICDNCGEAFSRKLFLQIHRKKHHTLKDDGQDENGETSLSGSHKDKSFNQEYDSADPSDAKSFTCHICGSDFSRLVIKLNHEKKCKEERKILFRLDNGNGFQCRICRRISTLKHNLMVHIRKAHSDVVKFDPSGHIVVRGKKDLSKDQLADDSSVDELPKGDDEEEEGSPPSKKSKMLSPMKKEDEDLSDDEMEALAALEDDEDDESDADERYTRVAGGFACATCRTKFVARDALFSHLESHKKDKDAKKESPTSEATESTETEEPQSEDGPSKENKTMSSQKETKTPNKSPGSSPKSLSTNKKVPSSRGRPPKTPSTPSAIKKETSAQTPTLPRSSNRPPRTQKIPSRFLE